MAKCKICGAEFVPYRSAKQTLCGSPKCKAENNRLVRARRVQSLRIQKAQKETRSCKYCGAEFQTTLKSGRVFCQNDCRKNWHAEQRLLANREHIECPFPKMQTMIPGISTWDCPEMDPLSGGFPMITFNVPNAAREVAA